jgi:serine/threonine protein kinase
VTELRDGSVFAGHRIEGQIGRGGMGVVYRAKHLALDRPVALKLITPDLASEPGFRERFQRESRIAAALDHPNVITVHHAGEDDGRLFITMRLIDGEDLGALLGREGRLAPERATRIVAQVGAALDAAHRAGLVHRDVKPANVLVSGSGDDERVFLTDFGLTKRDTSTVSLTRTGEIVGTLDYIAPEQIRGEAVDARTDVYALGCMLFHLVTGRVPFPADMHAAKVYAHLSDEPPAVTELAPDAPPGLDAVIRRAMDKDADRRFQSAGELADAALAATRAPAPMPDAAAAEPPRGRLRKLAPALIALVVGVAIAAGLLLGSGSGGSDSSSGAVSADEVHATLDSYQASMTNGDIDGIERLLAPDFTRQLLGGGSTDRAAALAQYQEGFRFRGDARRYSLSDVQVATGGSGASATARFSYTGTPEPHLGDYGSIRFQFAERDGRLLIRRIESYPDLIAFTPTTVRPSDYPITVKLTGTTDENGKAVAIAAATSTINKPTSAVKVPLNEAGKRVLDPGQKFTTRALFQLADGRRLSTVHTGFFAASLKSR